MNGEWILAIETSVASATLALACDGVIEAGRSFYSERSQECDLFPPLRELLGELPTGRKPATVVVGTGPGSYNGARVGIAAAQSIAQFHECPVVGICSFEGVEAALNHPAAWAVGDARRESFFILPLVNGRVRTPPKLLGKDEFLRELNDLQGPRITFESPDRLPAGTKATESHSTACGLVQAWQARSREEQLALQTAPVEAFYLRPPHITKSNKPGLV